MLKMQEIIEARINAIQGLRDDEREYLKWLKMGDRALRSRTMSP